MRVAVGAAVVLALLVSVSTTGCASQVTSKNGEEFQGLHYQGSGSFRKHLLVGSGFTDGHSVMAQVSSTGANSQVQRFTTGS